ncbi:hypothetical protein PN498_27060 [Oscillatoria sp. CS-180]|nr:hypothetical protein [Oscillatoria sp. CS-180]MDB9529677.1 hypothetical protein [Oscillatoria sp. CS-180]
MQAQTTIQPASYYRQHPGGQSDRDHRRVKNDHDRQLPHLAIAEIAME